MTEIRIKGDHKDKVLAVIKELFEVLEVQDYGNATYCTIKDELQKNSENNLQDWMIIEYCKEWRTTPQIMKYFKLEYDTAREILDRLYSSEALGRRLDEKKYAYINRDIVHRCKDCISYTPDDSEECCYCFSNGRCEANKMFVNGDELNRCDDFTPKQKVIV